MTNRGKNVLAGISADSKHQNEIDVATMKVNSTQKKQSFV